MSTDKNFNLLIKATNFLQKYDFYFKSDLLYKYYGKYLSLYLCTEDVENIYCLKFSEIQSSLNLKFCNKKTLKNIIIFSGVICENNIIKQEYFLTVKNAITLHENLLLK